MTSVERFLLRWREPCLGHLVLPIVLYMSMVFSSYTNLTNLIIDLQRRSMCGGLDDGACDDDDEEAAVSASAARTSSYVFLAESVCSILVVGHLGNMSDRLGRRPIAALSLTGNVAECILVVLIIRNNLPVAFLAGATAVQGLCGSYCGFLMACSAYVADLNGKSSKRTQGITEDEGGSSMSVLANERTERFSKFEVLLNLGAVIGPVLGGWSVARYSYTSYFLVCALLSIALLGYVAAMPEAFKRGKGRADGTSNTGAMLIGNTSDESSNRNGSSGSDGSSSSSRDSGGSISSDGNNSVPNKESGWFQGHVNHDSRNFVHDPTDDGLNELAGNDDDDDDDGPNLLAPGKSCGALDPSRREIDSSIEGSSSGSSSDGGGGGGVSTHSSEADVRDTRVEVQKEATQDVDRGRPATNATHDALSLVEPTAIPSHDVHAAPSPTSFLDQSTLGAVKLLWQTRSIALAEDDKDADGVAVAVAGVVVCGSGVGSTYGEGVDGKQCRTHRGTTRRNDRYEAERRATGYSVDSGALHTPTALVATAVIDVEGGACDFDFNEPQPPRSLVHARTRDNSSCDDSYRDSSYSVGVSVPAIIASGSFDSQPSSRTPLTTPLLSDTIEECPGSQYLHEQHQSQSLPSDGLAETSIGPQKVHSRLRLSLVSVAFFLTYGNTISASGLYVLYTRYAWGWGQYTVGIFLSTASLLGVAALLAFRPLFRALSGGRAPSDILMGQLGALASGIYFSLFASLESPSAAFALLPLLAVQTAATPSYRSLYSGCFGPHQQGQIFAAVSALEAIPGLVTPLAFDLLYSVTVTRGLASVAFFALSVAAVVAAVALCFVRIGPEQLLRIENDAEQRPSAVIESRTVNEERTVQGSTNPLHQTRSHLARQSINSNAERQDG